MFGKLEGDIFRGAKWREVMQPGNVLYKRSGGYALVIKANLYRAELLPCSEEGYILSFASYPTYTFDDIVSYYPLGLDRIPFFVEN